MSDKLGEILVERLIRLAAELEQNRTYMMEALLSKDTIIDKLERECLQQRNINIDLKTELGNLKK